MKLICSGVFLQVFKRLGLIEQSLLGMFAKLRKATFSFFMSVCLHGTTQLPLDEF
jgi:hypothetical protein